MTSLYSSLLIGFLGGLLFFVFTPLLRRVEPKMLGALIFGGLVLVTAIAAGAVMKKLEGRLQ